MQSLNTRLYFADLAKKRRHWIYLILTHRIKTQYKCCDSIDIMAVR